MTGTVMNADAQTSWRLTGVVSLVQGLLIFIPTIVLGQAIGWPASLGDPASVALPRLLQQESAVRLGYSAYLVYSMLFAVTILLLAKLRVGKSMANVLWLSRTRPMAAHGMCRMIAQISPRARW
jgi:hypothetical protein